MIPDPSSPRIAVLIPCYNEAATIADVVRQFKAMLLHATIYVYDNNSTDDTKAQAAEAGAIVKTENLQGKGNVVRRMFADVEAEIYILADGDGTYDAASAPRLIDMMFAKELDMVSCAREPTFATTHRPGHAFGNRLLTALIAWIFGSRFTDVLTGYRAMSRRFVKSFPALSAGFEIESEITIHALELRVPVDEISAPYRNRPQGSESKLHTFRDGMRILRVITHLAKEERPLQFFGAIAAVLVATSIALGWPVVANFFETGTVPRLPTALLATGMMISALLSLGCGLILDTVTRGRREFKRLMYLTAGNNHR